MNTLIQINLSNSSDFLLVAATALVVQCIILYYVIRLAVEAANERSSRYIKILIKMKKEELIRSGMTNQEVELVMYSISDL